MIPMSPADAQLILDGAVVSGGYLDIGYRRALETIAGMTPEHRHEVQSIADGTWHPLTEWTEGEPDRRPWNVTPTRIVRRYFTDPEVIT